MDFETKILDTERDEVEHEDDEDEDFGEMAVSDTKTSSMEEIHSTDDEDDVDSKIMEKKIFSVDDVMEELGYGCCQVLMFLYCGLLCFIESCDWIMLSLLLPVLRYRWEMTDTQETLLSSAVVIGTFFGGLLFGYFSDCLGRRPTIIISVYTTVVFCVLSCAFDNFYLFTIMRFFVGMYVGAVTIPHALFVEFLPNRCRGFILAIFSLFWNFGVVYDGLAGWVILPYFGDEAWRWYVLFSALPLFVAIPGTFCIPESPYYMAILKNEKNRTRKQIKIKKLIHRIEYWNRTKLTNMPDYSYDIKLVPPEKGGVNCTWKLFFIFLNIVLFNTGAVFLFNAVIFLVVDVFNTGDTDSASNSMYYSNLIVGCVSLGSNLFMVYLVVILPRKMVMGLSFFFGAMSMFFLGLPIGNFWYILAFNVSARFFVVISINMAYIVSQESLPVNIRGRSFGFAFAFSNLLSALYPVVVKYIGLKNQEAMFYLLGLISLLSTLSSFVHPIETKGKVQESIYNEKVELGEEEIDKQGGKVYHFDENVDSASELLLNSHGNILE